MALTAVDEAGENRALREHWEQNAALLGQLAGAFSSLALPAQTALLVR